MSDRVRIYYDRSRRNFVTTLVDVFEREEVNDEKQREIRELIALGKDASITSTVRLEPLLEPKEWVIPCITTRT